MESPLQNIWDSVLLGSLAEFKNGVNYSKENFGKGMKVINVGDFKDYTYAKLDDLDEINPLGIVREKDLLKNNDILFVRSNGNRELIGRSVIVSGLKEKISHSAFTIRGRFVSEKAMPRFYAYVLRSPQIRQKLSAYGGGTNISNLNQQILNSLQVPFPPLETQRKIASILSAYDDLIENNTRRIKILEAMARMLYREWFVNFRFPGHEQVKMADSPLGMIPEGWEAGQLSDIASIIPGYAFKSSDWTESGVPVIKIKNIQEDGTVNTDEADFVPECVITKKIEKFLLNHGDILIAMTGATAGKVGRLRSKVSMGLNQRVAKIQARKPYEVFVWHSVSNESARKLLFGLADGAAQPNMSGSQIESIKLCIPDENILQQFNVASMPMLHETDVLYLKNQNLRQTRDLLLPKLISGDVTLRVSDKYEEKKL